jgi:hypothetical protein
MARLLSRLASSQAKQNLNGAVGSGDTNIVPFFLCLRRAFYADKNPIPKITSGDRGTRKMQDHARRPSPVEGERGGTESGKYFRECFRVEYRHENKGERILAQLLLNHLETLMQETQKSEAEVMALVFQTGIRQLWREHILGLYLRNKISRKEAIEEVGLDWVDLADRQHRAMLEDISWGLEKWT